MKRIFWSMLMVANFLVGYSQPAAVEELNNWRGILMTQQGKTVGNESFNKVKDQGLFWWDGDLVLQMIGSGEDDNEVLMFNVTTNTICYTIQTKGSTGTVESRGLTVSLHKLGDTYLMVERENGKLFNILIQVTVEQPVWNFIDLHDVLDGLYTTPDGKQYVFGQSEMFEHIDGDTQDPGLFDWSDKEDPSPSAWNYHIIYGDRRISSGTFVGNPEDQNKPGGGGAGALMGPMEWGLKHTNAGLEGKVLHDEPTVDHHPAITEDFTLTKVQNPFKGVDGIWAFASVRPLNRLMLTRFPREILRLMRNEIYARHGEKFTSDPSIQAYFDSQPWYKASANPTPLTSLEKLNVSLIKAMEETMKELEK